MSFPLVMAILMAIAGLIFVGIIVNSYDDKYPMDGLVLLSIFPILAFIGSTMWFKSWYDYEYKKENKSNEIR